MKRLHWPRALVIAVAILSIASLEAVALATGHDGQLFLTVVASIGSISGGYAAAQGGVRDVLDAMDQTGSEEPGGDN